MGKIISRLKSPTPFLSRVSQALTIGVTTGALYFNLLPTNVQQIIGAIGFILVVGLEFTTKKPKK